MYTWYITYLSQYGASYNHLGATIFIFHITPACALLMGLFYKECGWEEISLRKRLSIVMDSPIVVISVFLSSLMFIGVGFSVGFDVGFKEGIIQGILSGLVGLGHGIITAILYALYITIWGAVGALVHLSVMEIMCWTSDLAFRKSLKKFKNQEDGRK